MEKVKKILRAIGASFHEEDGAVIVDDVYGYMYEHDGRIYFSHGDTEPNLSVDNPFLEHWVESYATGFDAFADCLSECCPS